MTTRIKARRLVVIGLIAGGALGATTVSGQVVERDVSITGPRGNTLERQIRTERRGNVVDREVTIRRPEGIYHRETEVVVPPGHHGRPGRPIPVGGSETFVGGGFGGPRVVERDVIIGGGGPPLVAPFFSFFVGSPPPPPPVFVAPLPPPVVVYNPPVRYAPAPPPQQVVVDPVNESIAELKSYHEKHRRDAAVTLGKLGDARAVNPLIDRLKHDHDKEVRMAAAWALAEIGDPRAIVPLEVAAQFDKKPDVRAVATKSLNRMPREVTSARDHVEVHDAPAPRYNPPATQRPSTNRTYNLDDIPPPDPTPAGPRSEPGSGFGSPR